eukprot:Unigene782_Nuclearia_a/m.2547 Unigene782_Nuclearia_a/g.2547  ORF Unigene782_Nuclearia_a/g.2547 Unigene782_Nuclearia_a/m.2547 type:complete len:231 (-) Unigene782_Nuclearia_a:132-824(-)
MGFTADLKCYKLLLVLVDFIFLVGGVLLIALGSWSLTNYVEGISSTNLAIGLIVLGCLVTLIALVGCCGAMYESRGLLKAYFGFVLVIMLVQIALGITAYVLRDDIPTWASEAWTNLTPQGKADLENAFDCCGWTDSTDRASPGCMSDSMMGCEGAIVNSIEQNLFAIGVTAICVGALELLVILFACCLIQRIPTKEEREQALLDEARRLNRDNEQTYYTTGHPEQKPKV